MTVKEKLLAALRGEVVRPRLELRLPLCDCGVRAAMVLNPFGLALKEGLDLTAELRRDPQSGARALDTLVRRVQAELREATANQAELAVYLLVGAEPRFCTPMEYGGYYLERDRELLSECSATLPTLLFVADGPGAYLDFLSDLPAHAFGWDANLTEVPANAMRAMRSGTLVSNDPSADIVLVPEHPGADLLDLLHAEVVSVHA